MSPSLPTCALLLLLLAGCTSARRNLAQDSAPSSESGDAGLSDNPISTGDVHAIPGLPTFTGDGTAFSDPVANNGSNFACSFRYLNNWASKYFVAMNEAQWNDGQACGKCVKARCVDSRCPVQNVDIVAMVVDRCPECAHGALDFSYPAYTAVTGSWPNRLTVQWDFVDCSPFIDGSIRIFPKDGGNPFWQAFYFANAKYQIANVTVDGVGLSRQTFGFWTHSGPAPSGAKIELTSVNGETVSTTLENAFAPQNLGVQFAEAPIATAGRK